MLDINAIGKMIQTKVDEIHKLETKINERECNLKALIEQNVNQQFGRQISEEMKARICTYITLHIKKLEIEMIESELY